MERFWDHRVLSSAYTVLHGGRCDYQLDVTLMLGTQATANLWEHNYTLKQLALRSMIHDPIRHSMFFSTESENSWIWTLIHTQVTEELPGDEIHMLVGFVGDLLAETMLFLVGVLTDHCVMSKWLQYLVKYKATNMVLMVVTRPRTLSNLQRGREKLSWDEGTTVICSLYLYILI